MIVLEAIYKQMKSEGSEGDSGCQHTKFTDLISQYL